MRLAPDIGARDSPRRADTNEPVWLSVWHDHADDVDECCDRWNDGPTQIEFVTDIPDEREDVNIIEKDREDEQGDHGPWICGLPLHPLRVGAGFDPGWIIPERKYVGTEIQIHLRRSSSAQ